MRLSWGWQVCPKRIVTVNQTGKRGETWLSRWPAGVVFAYDVERGDWEAPYRPERIAARLKGINSFSN
jgi:hypothetical protein